jgi:hypothetical protein
MLFCAVAGVAWVKLQMARMIRGSLGSSPGYARKPLQDKILSYKVPNQYFPRDVF